MPGPRALVCLYLILWLSIETTASHHSIALIAPAGEPLATGIVCGMIETGEAWAEAGGEMRIHFWTGIQGVESLDIGIDRSIQAGAVAIIIWGSGWDSGSDFRSTISKLQDLGLPCRILCPSPGSEMCDYIFTDPADFIQEHGDLRWRVDDPIAPKLLANGTVDVVLSPPLEEWGRDASLALLHELDPTRARLIERAEPPAVLIFTEETAHLLEERWRCRMKHSQTSYDFPRESPDRESE